MHDSEVIMLAHMIGGESCVKRQPVRYASTDEANPAAVSPAAAHFGVPPLRDEYAAARVTTLRLPASYRLTHGKLVASVRTVYPGYTKAELDPRRAFTQRRGWGTRAHFGRRTPDYQ